jgi:hypothetical protein
LKVLGRLCSTDSRGIEAGVVKGLVEEVGLEMFPAPPRAV